MPYAKQCKYNCGTSIIWDNNQSKFFETATKEWHSPDRCKMIKLGELKLPVGKYNAQEQKEFVDYYRPPQQKAEVQTTSQSLETAAILGKLDNMATQIQMIGGALSRIIESDADKRERMQLLQKIAELEDALKKKGLVQKASDLNKPIPKEVTDIMHEMAQNQEEGYSGNAHEHLERLHKKGETDEELDLTD